MFGPVGVRIRIGQGCFIGVKLLIRHVVHLQQLPTPAATLPRGVADDAHDNLAMQDHAPDPVVFKGLPTWNGSDPAAHAMTGRRVAHDGP
jgi:hypothetical protein